MLKVSCDFTGGEAERESNKMSIWYRSLTYQILITPGQRDNKKLSNSKHVISSY